MYSQKTLKLHREAIAKLKKEVYSTYNRLRRRVSDAAPKNNKTVPGEKDIEFMTGTSRKMDEEMKSIVLKTLTLKI